MYWPNVKAVLINKVIKKYRIIQTYQNLIKMLFLKLVVIITIILLFYVIILCVKQWNKFKGIYQLPGPGIVEVLLKILGNSSRYGNAYISQQINNA